MNGEDILQTMRDAYSKFDTYSDVGTVENLGQPWLPLEFQTYFKRPSNFRFQWLSWHPHFGKNKPPSEHTIYSNGINHVKCYSAEIERAERFSLLTAGATGVSSGAVNVMLNLLQPGWIRLRNYWHEMTAIRSLSDEVLNDFECFHLVGTVVCPDDEEVWIDKNSFVVRQLLTSRTTTEEDCAKWEEYQQSPVHLAMLKESAMRRNVPEHLIEEDVASMANVHFKLETRRHIYKYSEVKINQPIDDALFNNLNVDVS